MSTENPSSKENVSRYKERYESEFSRKTTLDQKANNMMVIGSTVVSLYSGFGSAILTNLFRSSIELSIQTSILIVGIIILIISISLATKAHWLKEYSHAINEMKLINEIDSQNKIKFDDEKIDQLQQRPIQDLHKLMIKVYVICTVRNRDTNESRVNDLRWSQRTFIVGLCTFPALMIAFVI